MKVFICHRTSGSFSVALLKCRLMGIALVIAGLIAFTSSVALTQPAPGTDCGCGKFGPFVDPNPGKAPYIDASSGDSADSNARYRLSATPGGANLPATVSVVRIADGATVLQTTGLFWGFSPDQDRFLIWSQTGGFPNTVFQATLYNLNGAAPGAPLRTFSGAFTSLRLRFSKDGRLS
jgi:hypothetical protein